MEQWKAAVLFLSPCMAYRGTSAAYRGLSGKLCKSAVSEDFSEKNLKKIKEVLQKFYKIWWLCKIGLPRYSGTFKKP